jgi:hypothetical protein
MANQVRIETIDFTPRKPRQASDIFKTTGVWMHGLNRRA